MPTKSLIFCTLALLAGCTEGAEVNDRSLLDESVVDLRIMQEKFAGLAAAVPASDYTNRVHPDVRSIGEELMHVASANFRYPDMLGIQPPQVPQSWIAGDADGIDQATAIDAVNESFDFMVAVVESVDDLDREMLVFGRPTNVRGFLVVMSGHLHEHLGKLISDSRAVGVVPPWSG